MCCFINSIFISFQKLLKVNKISNLELLSVTISYKADNRCDLFNSPDLGEFGKII